MISVLLCTEARKITINQMQMEETGEGREGINRTSGLKSKRNRVFRRSSLLQL